ncbi:hypothetical protein IWQ62_003891 [Dispira parvispora]|uniref:Uncharacterized protein n=1 Tax=Dispira parvispora TaxID=1520584 RepID=A0A9W8AMN6_9FUNG|nr:hypothetical protein IWQ62_003891 [Dispira parvispora]
MDTDLTPAKTHVEWVELMVPIFTGSVTRMTWQEWKEQFEEISNSFLQGVEPNVIFQLAKVRLHKDLQDEVEVYHVKTWDQLDEHMTDRFPIMHWMRYYVTGVNTGTLFSGQPLGKLKALAREAFERGGKTDYWAVTILNSLVKACEVDLVHAPDELWNLERTTVDEFEAKLAMVIKHVESGRMRILKQGAVPSLKPAVIPVPNKMTANQPQLKPERPETTPATERGGSKPQQAAKPKGNNRSLANQVKDLQAKVEALEQGKDVEAAADQGAATSLITLTAAKRLGLRINPTKRPNLQPYWGNTPLKVIGVANALFTTAESSKRRWLRVVVAKDDLDVELLVGRADLDRLGLDLREDHAMPEPKTPSNSIQQRRLNAPLGLPPGFFSKIDPKDNEEFRVADNKYPPVSYQDVYGRTETPTSFPELKERLVQTLMTGASCFREYPPTCPPPCQLAPVIPPFKDDAELLYVNQAPRSHADQAFIDEYVATRLAYNIDERGYANANVPVFSIPKPNCESRRVLMDDSIGSAANMKILGMDLPRPYQVRQFFGDAKLVRTTGHSTGEGMGEYGPRD